MVMISAPGLMRVTLVQRPPDTFRVREYIGSKRPSGDRIAELVSGCKSPLAARVIESSVAFLFDNLTFSLIYWSVMSNLSSVTIIDDKELRGVLAPKKLLSKRLLEDMVDLIKASSPEEIKETERLIREADSDNSWIPGKEIEKRLRTRLKASR